MARDSLHARVLSSLGRIAERHKAGTVVSEQTAQSLASHRKLMHALPAAEDADVSAPARRAERVARQLVELLDAELQVAGGRA